MYKPFTTYPQKAFIGDKITIIYNNGILIDDLKKDIYIIFGFGYDRMDKIYECKMIPLDKQYKAVIPIFSDGILFIYFKDSYGNIDDNNKDFYKIIIQKEE